VRGQKIWREKSAMETDLEQSIPLLEPTIAFAEVKVSEKAKAELNRYLLYSVILSFERRDLFPLGTFKDPKILLIGPKGTDMLHLAMAAASVMHAKFIPITFEIKQDNPGKQIYLGSPDKDRDRNLIKAVFSKAEKNRPCVIFLDNIDAIKDAQSEDDYLSEEYQKFHHLRYPLLEQLNVCREKRREGVIIIAATSRYDLLDVYIYGKFFKKIEF
jgi:SpoVK/Ycf46/Vps4 family AAA+-type ATPase